MLATIKGRERVLGAAVLAGLLLGIGCAGGASSSDNAAGGPPGSSPSGDGGPGDDGGGDPIVVPEAGANCVVKPGVDLPDDNFEDSDCDGIDGNKDAAIFVASLAGDDAAPGTIDHPVKTIAKAVALAATAGKYVIVANGTYADAIVVDGKAVSIYGGYKPHDWQRINDRAVVAPGTGVPLTIRNVASAITIDRLALTAPDATDPGASSYGAIVTGAQNATLKHLALTAGRGAAGVTPRVPDGGGTATKGADGQSLPTVSCDSSGPLWAQDPACGAIAARGWDGTIQTGAGGAGGQGWNQQVAQAYGHEGTPGTPSPLGGAAGTGDGMPGLDGTRGAAGTPATSGFGSVIASGYVASNTGTVGAPGSMGGSGGGGGGWSQCISPSCSANPTNLYYVGGGGGQGGYGGGGGVGSAGAGGGGASIGLFVFASNVTLASTDITTTDGGAGGDAVLGADGQTGGAPGVGGKGTDPVRNPQSNGHNGGPGGRGGQGGAGGPGGGGPSIAILASGAAPAKQGVTMNVGAGGKGGKGTQGVGDGADGITEELHLIGAGDAGASDAAAD